MRAGRGVCLALALLAGCQDREGMVASTTTAATAPTTTPTTTPTTMPTTTPTGMPQPKPRAATVALYGAAAETALTPYPSDRYLAADATKRTGVKVNVNAKTTGDELIQAFPVFADQLAGTDGFSTVGGVAVNFSHGIDESILALGVDDFAKQDAPIALIDVGPESPTRGELIPLIVRYYPTRLADGELRDDFTLAAQPARPLRPQTAYLFVVTTRLKDEKGAAVGPSEGMDALLTGTAEGDYGERVRAALPLLQEATGLGADGVALATVFTTASVIDETFAMGQSLRAAPPPALDGELQTLQVDPGSQRALFQGRYVAPEFRRAKPDGRFEIKEGAPVKQKDVSLEFLLSIAQIDQPGPHPVVIYGHGLGGDKGGVWGTSDRLAELGAAVIGIDAPEHGSRGTGSGADAQLDSVFNFFALDQKTGSFDLQRTRDNFRQMASDQLQLVRLINELATLDVLPVGAPDGVPDLDTSRIFYIGHSFGSVLASSALALAPEIQAGCLNVGGDGLMTVMRESGVFQLLVKGLKPKNLTDGDMARFFAASQGVVDPGDPLNFARYVSTEAGPGVPGWRPRHLLLQEVNKDKIVPNLSTELLARGLGLTHVLPAARHIGGLPEQPAPLSGNLTDGVTGGYFQFDVMDGNKKAEHGGLIFSEEARRQYVHFFLGVSGGGEVSIINPYLASP